MNEKPKGPLRRRLTDRRTRGEQRMELQRGFDREACSEDRRSANELNELIKERGLKGASDYAADRIAALLEMNDNHGANVWRRIRAALLDKAAYSSRIIR